MIIITTIIIIRRTTTTTTITRNRNENKWLPYTAPADRRQPKAIRNTERRKLEVYTVGGRINVPRYVSGTRDRDFPIGLFKTAAGCGPTYSVDCWPTLPIRVRCHESVIGGNR